MLCVLIYSQAVQLCGQFSVFQVILHISHTPNVGRIPSSVKNQTNATTNIKDVMAIKTVRWTGQMRMTVMVSNLCFRL